jgi:hypothetical protein
LVEFITPSPYIEDIVEGAPFALLTEGKMKGMLPIPRGPGLGIRWSVEGIFKHSGMRVSDTVNYVPGAAASSKL